MHVNHLEFLNVKLGNNNSGGALDIQTWQTKWKIVALAKAQLCEYENLTLEAFVVFVCWVGLSSGLPEFLTLAAMHDCETVLYNIIAQS